MVSQSPIGTKVKVKVFRAKKELEIEVTIAELPKKAGEAATEEDTGENQEESNALSGVTVRELTPELAKRFGAKEGDSGLVVVRVDPNSKAFEVGIRPGDIVLQINQKDIATIEDYKKVVEKLKAKERILLLVRRKGEDLFLTIRPE
jgi:serine protease Do